LTGKSPRRIVLAKAFFPKQEGEQSFAEQGTGEVISSLDWALKGFLQTDRALRFPIRTDFKNRVYGSFPMRQESLFSFSSNNL
jgi:hypothetical protein